MKLKNFSIRELLWLALVAGLGTFLVQEVYRTGKANDVLIFAVVIPVGVIPVLWNWLTRGREGVRRGVVTGLISNLLLVLIMLILCVLLQLGIVTR